MTTTDVLTSEKLQFTPEIVLKQTRFLKTAMSRSEMNIPLEWIIKIEPEEFETVTVEDRLRFKANM